MGKNNRNRRADKKRRRQRGGDGGADRRQGSFRYGGTGGGSGEPAAPGDGSARQRERERAQIVAGLRAAALAFWPRQPGLLDDQITLLAEGPGGTGGARWASLVDQVAGEQLVETVTELWRRGWQPGDVPFLVARNPAGPGKLGPVHQRLAIDAIAAEAQGYAAATLDPRWADQLDSLEAERWWDPGRPHLSQWAEREGLHRAEAVRAVAETLSVLMRLGPVERLGPLPGTVTPPPSSGRPRAGSSPPGDAGPKMLAKVRALLAKAESTTFPEEAETLTAKAQELMARYAIDQAMVDSADGQARRVGGAVGWRIHHEDPYASGKASLLAAVGRANRCRTVYTSNLGFSTVFGFPVDLRNTEVLFTSLQVQATAAMAAAGRQTDQLGRSRTRSFRSSFFEGYAHRVGQRLQQANDTTVAEAGAHHGGALVPVLTARQEAVEELMGATFPRLSRRRTSVSNGSGWYAGQAAGELADLGHHAAVKAPRAS